MSKSNSDLPLFDAVEGRRRRDEGIAQVLTNAEDWKEAAYYAALGVLDGLAEPFIGEDIKAAVIPIAGVPHHPNAWGGLIHGLVRKRFIIPTGTMRRAKSAARHSSNCAEYRRRRR